MYVKKFILASAMLLMIVGMPAAVLATTYSSSSYKVLDPVIDSAGGRRTSSSYILLDALGQNAIGLSNAASFTVKSGFLYFAAASSDSDDASSEAVAAALQSNVPMHILPLIRPLLPIPIPKLLTPEAAEELINKHLPCQNGARAEDLNCDNVVGLIDFSIFLYLGGEDQKNRRPNFADFNQDGAVNIQDLSRLFYAWNEILLTLNNSDAQMEFAGQNLDQNSDNAVGTRVGAIQGISAESGGSIAPQSLRLLGERQASIFQGVHWPKTSWSGIAALLASIITLRFVFMRFGLL